MPARCQTGKAGRLCGRPIGRANEAVCTTHGPGLGGSGGTRHALPRTVVGVDWQDSADGGQPWLDHELSHHMGGRGGGRGGSVAAKARPRNYRSISCSLGKMM